MSSILQSFIHNPIVRNYYLSDSHHTNLCTRTNCIHCTINTVFSNMYTSTRPDPTIAFGPTDFISTVWKIDNKLAGADQQDSHEFLMFLLNWMHTHHFAEEGSHSMIDERKCKCLAHQVFGGESQSQVTCIGCGKVTRKFEMMFDLGLQIRGKSKIVINLNGKNGKNGTSIKGSPTSPSSSAGSSDIGDVSTTQSLQECLDRYLPLLKVILKVLDILLRNILIGLSILVRIVRLQQGLRNRCPSKFYQMYYVCNSRYFTSISCSY